MTSHHEDIVDVLVARLAAEQYGLVTLAQLRGLGVSRAAIRSHMAAGRWTGVGSSVLRVGGAPVTWESEQLAAVLGAGDPAIAVASHAAAARLWGLTGYEGAGPEVTVPHTRSFRRRGTVVHRSADLHLVAPVIRSGIPTTSVARTLLDLGAVEGESRVAAAVDEARMLGLVGWGCLLETLVLHARRGRDGVATLRRALDRHFDEVVRLTGGFSRLLLVLLRNAGLPPVVAHHEVVLPEGAFVVDLAVPAGMVAFEVEGHDVRGDPRARWVAGRALTAAGWTVVRVGRRDYLHQPSDVVRRARRALTGVGV